MRPFEFFRYEIQDGRHGSIAQRLEQGTHNPLVPGSNPGGPTGFYSSSSGWSEIHSPVVDKFANSKKEFEGRGTSLEVIWMDVVSGCFHAFLRIRFDELGARKCR